MIRFTNKEEEKMYKNTDVKAWKLCKLENLEEELHLDFELIGNVLKKGSIYNKTDFAITELTVLGFSKGGIMAFEPDGFYSFDLRLDKYGKTWALTKRELE